MCCEGVVAEPLLLLSSLSIAFGGLRAVQDVSLQVAPGTLSALIGPNGAGKTTLFALMSGFLKPDAGTVRFDGHDITGLPPHLNARAGMTRTFQIVQPFAAQTVRETSLSRNTCAAASCRGIGCGRGIARRVGLAPLLDQPAGELTVAGRKRLELARALATRPKLLLLDEVLAGLNPQEIEEMLPIVRTIVHGDASSGMPGGVTVLMIEHVMQAVMNLAEHVWVLAQGQLIAAGTPAEVTNDDLVIEAYLGHGTAARLRGAAR
jgi:branched-chain amino acid transport system ATP-binding protein